MTDLQQQRLNAAVAGWCWSEPRVIHGYASIDYELVWQVANKDLLHLHAQLKRIKATL